MDPHDEWLDIMDKIGGGESSPPPPDTEEGD